MTDFKHVLEIFAKNRLTKKQVLELLDEIKKAVFQKNDDEVEKRAKILGKKYINEKNPNDGNDTTLH